MTKPVFSVSDQVRHKPGCTATDDKRLEFWNFLEVEGLYYPCSENKGADKLSGYCAADLCLCFRKYKRQFSHDVAQIAKLTDINLKNRQGKYFMISLNRQFSSILSKRPFAVGTH